MVMTSNCSHFFHFFWTFFEEGYLSIRAAAKNISSQMPQDDLLLKTTNTSLKLKCYIYKKFCSIHIMHPTEQLKQTCIQQCSNYMHKLNITPPNSAAVVILTLT